MADGHQTNMCEKKKQLVIIGGMLVEKQDIKRAWIVKKKYRTVMKDVYNFKYFIRIKLESKFFTLKSMVGYSDYNQALIELGKLA